MKALAALLIVCTAATALAVAVLLRGPAWAWWVHPPALAALTVTAGVLTLVLVPRGWWR